METCITLLIRLSGVCKIGALIERKCVLVTMSFNHNPTLAELENELLALQLTRFSRRQAQAAETLGIGERSICRMIKRFGLKAE